MKKISKNLLFVEDNAIIAMDQKKQLEECGYTVIHTINGEKAVKFIKEAKQNIDLILMDIDLGDGIDGTQAAREILKLKEIPVLFLSSHTEPEIVRKTESITSYGYVVKKSGITVLDASIKMAFKLFSAHKDILKHKLDAENANTALKSTVKNIKIINESLIRLDRAIENTNEIIFITNIDGLITYINPQFTKTYGYTKEETLGKICPRDLGVETITDEDDANFWKTLRSKHHINTHYINKTRDGKVITVETSIDPIFDNNGNLKEFVQIQRDITEKNIVEEKLLKSNESLRFLNTIANEQANISNFNDLIDLIVHQLKSITNAVFVTFSEYQSTTKMIKNIKVVAENSIINTALKIAGEKILSSEILVDEKIYLEIITERIKTFPTLYECTHGGIGIKISTLVQKALKISEIWGLAFFIDNKLYGTSIFALTKGQTAPTREVIDSFMNISSISIRRHCLGKKQKARESKIRNLNQKQTHLSDRTEIMKAMLDNYNEAIWSVDKEFRFIFVNTYFIQEFKEAFGIDLKPGMHAFSNVRPSLKKIWKPKYEAALAGGKISFEFEEDALRGKRYFRVNLNPIYTNGIISGVSAVSVDITMEKLSELKVLQEEIRSQQYLDIAGVMFIAIDKNGMTTLVNKKLCEITGYKEEELIGKNWFNIMLPEKLKAEIIPVSKKLLNGEIEPVEYYENPILTKSGEERLIAWHNTIITDEKGGITGHLSSGEDITEQRILENKRKIAENKVNNLLAEKELILKEVHHRIKNNMTTLLSLVALQKNTVEGEESENSLLEIENRIRSMMILYETLYQSTDFESASVKNYLSALIDNIIENFPNTSIISVKKQITDFKMDTKAIFNIGIIINELITNSMKYAFKGKASGTIDFWAIYKNQNLVITVADNGIGLPSDINFNKNTGFGMKLVKMLVDQIEGDIKIERKHGTKFIITCEKEEREA